MQTDLKKMNYLNSNIVPDTRFAVPAENKKKLKTKRKKLIYFECSYIYLI